MPSKSRKPMVLFLLSVLFMSEFLPTMTSAITTLAIAAEEPDKAPESTGTQGNPDGLPGDNRKDEPDDITNKGSDDLPNLVDIPKSTVVPDSKDVTPIGNPDGLPGHKTQREPDRSTQHGDPDIFPKQPETGATTDKALSGEKPGNVTEPPDEGTTTDESLNGEKPGNNTVPTNTGITTDKSLSSEKPGNVTEPPDAGTTTNESLHGVKPGNNPIPTNSGITTDNSLNREKPGNSTESPDTETTTDESLNGVKPGNVTEPPDTGTTIDPVTSLDGEKPSDDEEKHGINGVLVLCVLVGCFVIVTVAGFAISMIYWYCKKGRCGTGNATRDLESHKTEKDCLLGSDMKLNADGTSQHIMSSVVVASKEQIQADIVPQQDQFSESGCSSHKADVRVDSSSLYQQDDLPESRHSIDSFSTENSQELPPRTDLSYYTEQSTRTSLTTLALPQTPTDVVPAEQVNWRLDSRDVEEEEKELRRFLDPTPVH